MPIFGKAAGLQPAALLKINSYLGFYQGFLELMLKRRIFGGLFLPLISRGRTRVQAAIATIWRT